jgi:DNA mismatch repair ATPase MutS
VHDLLGAGRRLAAIDDPGLETELGAIRAVMGRLSGLARSTSWLLVDTTQANELVAVFVTYVNAFLLLDLTSLTRSLSLVDEHRGDLRALFSLVGNLDAAIAVASFRAGLARFSRPEIDAASRVLELEEATHPLVARAVPNGIRIDDRSVLVTGGNMAGKSTFVRTVAINALLAQTIYTTLATVYRAPVLRVRTLMSASDDVQRNRSYYYAELERAKGLLVPSADGTRTLVVLDELFRGTNTSERIGAGKAVLEALTQAGHIVFAATHDRELVGLLAERFDPYHFGEDIVGGDLVFPYDLRKGPSTTRNAILLMRIVGFPEQVVEDATGVVERLEAS